MKWGQTPIFLSLLSCLTPYDPDPKQSTTAGSDGLNVGNLRSHAITDGLVSFDDANGYGSALVLGISAVGRAFDYLKANLTGGETVAFTVGGNSFLFQDQGADDLAVRLTGVTATGLSTDGLMAGGVWLV